MKKEKEWRKNAPAASLEPFRNINSYAGKQTRQVVATKRSQVLAQNGGKLSVDGLAGWLAG